MIQGIQTLEPEDGWFWVSESNELISIHPAPGVDLTDPDVKVKVTLRKRLLHHWRPQTSTSLTPIAIRNLVVEHAGDYGIYLQNVNNVTIEDIHFRRNKIDGLSLGGGNGMRVSRSTFTDNGVSGFNGSGTNMLFEDLEIMRNGRLAVYSNYTGWANEGFKLGFVNHVTMKRLLMEDNYGVQAWFDTGIYNTELIDSVIRGGLTSGVFIENNNPNNIPGLGETPTVIVRNNVIYNHVTRSRFSNLVARGISLSENYNAIIENNLIVENDHGIALAANIRGQSFFNVVRQNVISTIGDQINRLYYPRNALIDWQEFLIRWIQHQ
ncbi:MAG: right-handed parallel beta-helix repeat-containing protein [Verrucomicrobia bacterium]|nr:right-handed parallel beta-helix repeat-containing protein [Verrucomicrobiota bacterium]